MHDVPYFQSSYLVSSVVNVAVMSQPVSTLMLVKEREEVLAINDKICFFFIKGSTVLFGEHSIS